MVDSFIQTRKTKESKYITKKLTKNITKIQFPLKNSNSFRSLLFEVNSQPFRSLSVRSKSSNRFLRYLKSSN